MHKLQQDSIHISNFSQSIDTTRSNKQQSPRKLMNYQKNTLNRVNYEKETKIDKSLKLMAENCSNIMVENLNLSKNSIPENYESLDQEICIENKNGDAWDLLIE